MSQVERKKLKIEKKLYNPKNCITTINDMTLLQLFFFISHIDKVEYRKY